MQGRASLSYISFNLGEETFESAVPLATRIWDEGFPTVPRRASMDRLPFFGAFQLDRLLLVRLSLDSAINLATESHDGWCCHNPAKSRLLPSQAPKGT
jgi:hypothetical protein